MFEFSFKPARNVVLFWRDATLEDCARYQAAVEAGINPGGPVVASTAAIENEAEARISLAFGLIEHPNMDLPDGLAWPADRAAILSHLRATLPPALLRIFVTRAYIAAFPRTVAAYVEATEGPPNS